MKFNKIKFQKDSEGAIHVHVLELPWYMNKIVKFHLTIKVALCIQTWVTKITNNLLSSTLVLILSKDILLSNIISQILKTKK